MVNSEFGGSGIGYISGVRARLTISQDAFRFTLYSTSRVVSRAPRVRREIDRFLERRVRVREEHGLARGNRQSRREVFLGATRGVDVLARVECSVTEP